MNEEEFTNPNGYFEIVGLDDSFGFVPKFLPPDIIIDETLINKCNIVNRSLYDLSALFSNQTLDSIALMSNISYVTKVNEALNSSRIEGTTTSFGEFLEYQANLGTVNSNSPYIESSNREVLNNLLAIEFMLDEIKKNNYLTIETVCACQQRLLTGLIPGSERNRDRTPGQVRSSNARIGSKIVCPPPGKLDDLLGNFIDFVNNDRKYHPLIRIAISHYQFEAIHPFGDGNGRTGRIIIQSLLAKYGLLESPVISPSMFLSQMKKEYFENLYAVSAKSNWADWISFFLESIEKQILVTRDVINRYIAASEQIGKLLEEYKIYKTSPTVAVLNAIIQKPIFSVRQIEVSSGIGSRTVRNIVDKLIDLKILKPFVHDGKTQKYICDYAMRIFEHLDR